MIKVGVDCCKNELGIVHMNTSNFVSLGNKRIGVEKVAKKLSRFAIRII